MSKELIERSKGHWRGILTNLGISPAYLTGKHTACPMCGGKDRFRFDDKNGSGSWICNNCGSGYGIHLVQKALGFGLSRAQEEVERIIGAGHVTSRDVTATSKRRVNVAGIWSEAREARSNAILSSYLEGRALKLTDDLRAIRFAPRTLYLDDEGNFAGTFPCMLGLIQSQEGKAAGLHRTYLASNGSGKASVPYPKKTLGDIPDGAAVRLFTREEHLGIAEGIETALAARQLFDIPVWAGLTAGNMEKWTPPDGVSTVTVFGDNDRNYRGQKAAFHLAHRLAIKGYSTNVEIPPASGTDWNDVLRGAS